MQYIKLVKTLQGENPENPTKQTDQTPFFGSLKFQTSQPVVNHIFLGDQ